jgi:GT2 family glycosyltransferase
MRKIKIAISLLTCNDFKYSKDCISSLLESDLFEHEVKLFHWDNNSTDGINEFVEQLDIDKEVTVSQDNQGIVIPRINLFNKIKDQGFDFLLELHADMLFPKQWFNALLEVDTDNAIILQPGIFLSKNIISVEDLEKHCTRRRVKKVHNKSRQVHPWLIKLKKIDEVGGYYLKDYHPQRCEDDDLVWRILSSGRDIVSSENSWVMHYAGVTRHKELGGQGSKNHILFQKINSASIKDLINLTKVHLYEYI